MKNYILLLLFLVPLLSFSQRKTYTDELNVSTTLRLSGTTVDGIVDAISGNSSLKLVNEKSVFDFVNNNKAVKEVSGTPVGAPILSPVPIIFYLDTLANPDVLYWYNSTTYITMPSDTVAEIATKYDITKQLKYFANIASIPTTLELGERIKIEDTGAEYFVQNTTVASFNGGAADGVAVIDLGNSKYAVIQKNGSGFFYVDHFGAIPNDEIDDKAAFEKAFNFSEAIEGQIVGSKGVYDIESRIIIFDREKDLRMDLNGATMNMPEQGFLSVTPVENLTKTITTDIIRNDSFFIVNDASGITEGDIIRVFSDSQWETGWGYTENDVSKVVEVSNDTIYVDRKFLFSYQVLGETVSLSIRKPFFLEVKNANLVFESEIAWAKSNAIVSAGVRANFENISIRDTTQQIFHRGIVLSASIDVSFSNMKFTDMEYGVLLNYSKDIVAINTNAKRIRHAYTFNNACENGYVSILNGFKCQGVMDSHQSFNIHYDKVRDIEATEFSNIRALGATVTNSFFDVEDGFYQLYTYWSSQQLTAEYEYIYSDYDVYYENVDWVHDNVTKFNGITFFEAKKATIKNCRTHNVTKFGSEGITREINIIDSEIGHIHTNTQNVKIINCEMNGDLSPFTKYVFRPDGTGKFQVINTTLKNYLRDTVALIDLHLNTPDRSFHFENCELDSLRRWSNLINSPNLADVSISFINSNVRNWIDTLPFTLESGLKSFEGSTFSNLGGEDYFLKLGATASRPQNLNNIHRGFAFYNAQTFIMEFWNGIDWTTPTTHPDEVTLASTGYGLQFDNSAWGLKKVSLDLELRAFRGFTFYDTESSVTIANFDIDGDFGIGTGSIDAAARLEVAGGNVRFSDYGLGNVTGGSVSQVAVFDVDGDVEEWPISSLQNYTYATTNDGVDLDLAGSVVTAKLDINELTGDASPVTSTTYIPIQTGAFGPKKISIDELTDRNTHLGFMSFGGLTEVIVLTGTGTSDWVTNGTNTLYSNEISEGSVIAQGDSIIVNRAGLTTVDVSISFAGGNFSHFTFRLNINGTDIDAARFDRDMTGTGIGTGSFHYAYNATSGDVLKLVIEETSGSTDLTAVDGSILVEILN